jgi:hypothetical protein
MDASRGCDVFMLLSTPGPVHVPNIFSAVQLPVDYITNLTEVASAVGVDLTVGKTTIESPNHATSPKDEVDQMDAFASLHAETGVYFHANQLLSLLVFGCYREGVLCENPDCTKCNGASSQLIEFLDAPAHWENKSL